MYCKKHTLDFEDFVEKEKNIKYLNFNGDYMSNVYILDIFY